ncbi:MAG: LUD domain-containing protein [Desulfurella sp.]|jgi:L-lactate dehydrogenase complex protein LldG
MIKKLKESAKINKIDVIETESLDFIGKYKLDITKEYDCNNDVGFVKALCVSADSAQTIIDIDKKEKLDKIMKTQNLYIVFSAQDIKENLIDAYKFAKQKKESAYYIFISQESKTADIEKTLVSGVQGPKKVVFVCVK